MNFFDYLFRETKNLDKDFLIGAKEHISFDNLYTNCLAVAGYLQKYIGTGQNIILASHNNLFFITTYLGILKSGNVVVPLNPAIEQYNFDYIVNQCGAVLAFMAKNIHTKASRLSTIIDEEGLQRIIAKQIFTNLSLSGDKNLAEIIYTSGSTGDSKGVMLSHKNLIANTASIIEYLNLSETDIMLVVMPFYYCYGLSILHTHLKVGGSIVLNNSFIFLGGILRDLNIYKCT
jgi:acyl-CoA synthetase (AMP-forming)/AMP-acid ligase II